MKFNKLIIWLLLGLTLSSCSYNNKCLIDFYNPKATSNKFYSSSSDYFNTNFVLNRNNVNKYKFIKAEVSSKQSIIKNKNIKKINKRVVIRDDYENKIFSNSIISDYTGEYDYLNSLDSLIDEFIINSYKKTVLNVPTKYYSSPFTVEREYVFLNKKYNVKTVFTDEFFVDYIIAKSDDNEIKINYYYYNQEDLPVNYGEINKETYSDIGYLYKWSPSNYSGVNVSFSGDVRFDKVTHIEIFENVVADVNFKLLSLDNGYINGYLWQLDKINIVNYDEVDLLSNLITEIIYKVDNRIYYDDRLNVQPGLLEGNTKYYCNPLTLINHSSKEELKVEFNENGALTKYIQKDKETNCEFEILFTYY